MFSETEKNFRNRSFWNFGMKQQNIIFDYCAGHKATPYRAPDYRNGKTGFLLLETRFFFLCWSSLSWLQVFSRVFSKIQINYSVLHSDFQRKPVACRSHMPKHSVWNEIVESCARGCCTSSWQAQIAPPRFGMEAMERRHWSQKKAHFYDEKVSRKTTLWEIYMGTYAL